MSNWVSRSMRMMENCPRVTKARWMSPLITSSSPKQSATAAGMSKQVQSQGRHSHTSTSFMLRISGSTASTTAVGRLCWGTHWVSLPLSSEENTLAPLSLPKRMARLLKTARPQTSTGRATPRKASAVMR